MGRHVRHALSLRIDLCIVTFVRARVRLSQCAVTNSNAQKLFQATRPSLKLSEVPAEAHDPEPGHPAFCK